MSGRAPKFLRYTIASIVVLWAALNQLGVLAFGYGILAATIPSIPPLTTERLLGLIMSPVFIVALGMTSAGSALVGKIRYGSLAAFSIAMTKRVDSLFNYSLFDEPMIEGRIHHDEVTWRCRYWDDDRVEVATRECPFCGLELVESFLPQHVVFGPNTAFEPGKQSRESADEAWHDVFGERTAEDRKETLSLACPQCNFSIPGEKGVMEGRDGARAKFRQHIDQMLTGGSRQRPFKKYADLAQNSTGTDPTPQTLWDAYVTESSAPDVLRIGVQSPSEIRTDDRQEHLTHNSEVVRTSPDRDSETKSERDDCARSETVLGGE